MLLSHLLAADGIDSVIVEARTQAYVLSRIRAGILEDTSVQLLRSVGLGDRLDREGLEHRGIYLQLPGHRQHVDFADLVGRTVTVYGQTEVQKDLVAARAADAQIVYYQASDVALHDITAERPSVTFTDGDGTPCRIEASVIAGCDGSFGPSRSAIADNAKQTWSRTYPYSWLGVLADVAPSTDELIYAWHPEGFAMHSMRSPNVSRFYLQVPNDTDITDWSADRIWTNLQRRLGEGIDGWTLRSGPILESSVLPMRSYVSAPMRHGNLFLAGDAAHIVPPTGAKGLNLAISDVGLLAPALSSLLDKNDDTLADRYSETALRRVWRSTHFSSWMTNLLHVNGDPFDAQLQRSQLEWIRTSRAAAADLAANYTGAPLADWS